MEGEKHFPKILNLIKTEGPDVICLQECPENFLEKLHQAGFYTTFAPVRRQIQNDVEYIEGNTIATKSEHQSVIKYYYQPDRTLPEQPVPTPNDLKHHNFILTQTEHTDGQTYNIATTHGIYTVNGLPTEHQTQGNKKMLSLLAQEKAHVLCGDMNIPRNVNILYNDIIQSYQDTVPTEYKASLDRAIHIHGKNPNLTEPIFDNYMIDYIFSKPGYIVSNVRLQFGVSDHAAVIAEIEKQQD